MNSKKLWTLGLTALFATTTALAQTTPPSPPLPPVVGASASAIGTTGSTTGSTGSATTTTPPLPPAASSASGTTGSAAAPAVGVTISTSTPLTREQHIARALPEGCGENTPAWKRMADQYDACTTASFTTKDGEVTGKGIWTTWSTLEAKIGPDGNPVLDKKGKPVKVRVNHWTCAFDGEGSDGAIGPDGTADKNPRATWSRINYHFVDAKAAKANAKAAKANAERETTQTAGISELRETTQRLEKEMKEGYWLLITEPDPKDATKTVQRKVLVLGLVELNEESGRMNRQIGNLRTTVNGVMKTLDGYYDTKTIPDPDDTSKTIEVEVFVPGLRQDIEKAQRTANRAQSTADNALATAQQATRTTITVLAIGGATPAVTSDNQTLRGAGYVGAGLQVNHTVPTRFLPKARVQVGGTGGITVEETLNGAGSGLLLAGHVSVGGQHLGAVTEVSARISLGTEACILEPQFGAGIEFRAGPFRAQAMIHGGAPMLLGGDRASFVGTGGLRIGLDL